MSSRRLGPKRGTSSVGGFAWPHGTHDRRSAHDDRPGAAVVADRQVAPVRQQRLRVGPEETSEVRRVLERGVEVDVVRRPRTEGRARRPRAGRDRLPRGRARRCARSCPPTTRGRARGTGSASARRTPAPRPCAARSRTPCPTRNPTRGASPPTEKTPKPTPPVIGEASRAPRAPRPARRSCSCRSSGRARAARERARRRRRSARATRTRRRRARMPSGSVSASAASSSPLEDHGREQVEEAVLAVRAHGVMEPGGRLEHQPALPAPANEARELRRRSERRLRRIAPSPAARARRARRAAPRAPRRPAPRRRPRYASPCELGEVVAIARLDRLDLARPRGATRREQR